MVNTSSDLLALLTDTHPPPGLWKNRKSLDELARLIWNNNLKYYTKTASRPLADSVRLIVANVAASKIDAQHATGLCVSTWNRPLYLEKCLASLEKSNLSETVTVLVDDASEDDVALSLIHEFDLDTPLIKVFKKRRRQINHSLDLGWNLLKGLGCRYLVNLDSDAVVAENWLDALHELNCRNICRGDKIIYSAFNRADDDSVVHDAEDYRIKLRLGGINYFFEVSVFKEIRQFLFSSAWDALVQGYFEHHREEGYRLICSKPSYVQHIGVVGMNSGPLQSHDVATDFVGNFPAPRS